MLKIQLINFHYFIVIVTTRGGDVTTRGGDADGNRGEKFTNIFRSFFFLFRHFYLFRGRPILEHFAGRNFRGWPILESFAEETFAKRAKTAKPRKFLPAKVSSFKVPKILYYRNYNYFNNELFRNGELSMRGFHNVECKEFEAIILDTLDRHAPHKKR